MIAPPDHSEPLTVIEARGRDIFEGRGGCGVCHAITDGQPQRARAHLDGLDGLEPKRFAKEPKVAFKAPNLRFVAHTPPYYHDGSASTLEQLLNENHDRMGSTDALDADERQALLAYLQTL
ncbi:MAG: hypothetical protein NVS3B20_24400 [Polyangiales bacterium]